MRPTCTAADAANIVGCSTAITRKLLANRFMRADDAPDGRLTIREVTLLAIAQHLGLRGDDRWAFVTMHRNDRRLDDPVTMTIFWNGALQVVPADQAFFYGDLPPGAAVFTNTAVIAAMLELPEPPPTLF